MIVRKRGYVVQSSPQAIMQKENSLSETDSRYPYYQVLSDVDACDDCQAHHGTIIPSASAEAGKNLPPFHPNCKCEILGRFDDRALDPLWQETVLWTFLTAENMTDKKTVQLLRNFYSVSTEVHTDQELLIKLQVSKLGEEKIDQIIQNFINRLNLSWQEKNLNTKFSYSWSGKYITEQFKQKTVDIAALLGVEPDALMKVMASESRLDPTAENKYAIGLIQFTKPACEQLGISRDALEQMSAEEQLDWVYEYFKSSAYQLDNEVDLYWKMFTTKPIGKEDASVIYDKGTQAEAGYYNLNAGIDIDKDGKITRRDLAEHLQRQLADFWDNYAK